MQICPFPCFPIYDFKTGCVKTECLHEGWQTSGSVKVVRMAFTTPTAAIPIVISCLPSCSTRARTPPTYRPTMPD
ncbi:hypothetical protein DW181_06000 [Clostridium sp. AM16-23]|nr:hypothetical protein DW181_06000 [Clostridium sp. AM16-23]